MNIQRYDFDIFEGRMNSDNDGNYVLYADHIAAIAEVAGLSDEAIYNDGVAAERARIRKAVEEMEITGGFRDPFTGECSIEVAQSLVLSIIDGDES